MNKFDLFRLIFGYLLLFILAVLAAAIALGKVEESTSYGLMPLVTSLSTLAGAFAGWAFGRETREILNHTAEERGVAPRSVTGQSDLDGDTRQGSPSKQ